MAATRMKATISDVNWARSTRRAISSHTTGIPVNTLTSSSSSANDSQPWRSSVVKSPGSNRKRSPSSPTMSPSGRVTSSARTAVSWGGGSDPARSATENTSRTPGSCSRASDTCRISSSWAGPASGSNPNSPTSGVAPPNSSSVRSKARRTGSSSLKKNSWSEFTSSRGMNTAANTSSPTDSTTAGVRRRTSVFSPAVTRGPINAERWRGSMCRRLIRAGSEKNEMTPAKVMPTAVNRPSCRIGCTSVASSDRKPAAVLMVVRIIGTPTCDSAELTRRTGSAPARVSS